MAVDLSGFSLARFPLLRLWKRFGEPMRLPGAWQYSRHSIWSERFFYGPNELRIQMAVLPSVEETARFIRDVMSEMSAVPPRQPINQFADGTPRKIGGGRAVHRQVRRMFFGVWLFPHREMIHRWQAEPEELLSEAQCDRLLRSVSAELKKRAEAFTHNR